jgi:hypothetical protein
MMSAVVTLEVFSGRPDPHWSLTAREEVELDRRVSNASIIRAPARHDEPLGYRGFRIHINAARGRDTDIWIYNGCIVARGQTRKDRGRYIERWLLKTGKTELPSELAAYVDGEIAGKP